MGTIVWNQNLEACNGMQWEHLLRSSLRTYDKHKVKNELNVSENGTRPKMDVSILGEDDD